MNYWIFKCNPELYRIDDRLYLPNLSRRGERTRLRPPFQDGNGGCAMNQGPARAFGVLISEMAESDNRCGTWHPFPAIG
jgi:hypothetical protein